MKREETIDPDQKAARSTSGALQALAWTGRFIAAALAVALAGSVIGFAWFTTRIATEEVAVERNADAIVVLTGGAARIADAIELLATGRGERLLISGVHPATTFGELARRTPTYERLFACCVDLDRTAVNTVGNAIQTREWAMARGFRSLIIVTSNYHLPRSMAELSRQLPDVDLVPFPVVTDRLRNTSWWSDPGTMRILVSEYVKYVLAHLRMPFDSAPLATGLAEGRATDSGEFARGAVLNR